MTGMFCPQKNYFKNSNNKKGKNKYKTFQIRETNVTKNSNLEEHYESNRCSSYTNVRLEESQYLSGFQLI